MLPASPRNEKIDWVNVPVILGERSFDEEREAELSEIFQHSTEQLRRHTAEWQQTVKHMRDNFVRLHPVDADHPLTTAGDVIVESEKIRMLFFEYPPDAGDERVLSTSTSAPSTQSEFPGPTRYQVRFDVSNSLPTSVTVTAEVCSVVVRASSTSPAGQCCAVRVPVPHGVQRDRLRAFLSVDGVLTVEAPLVVAEVDEPRTTSIYDDDDDDAGGGDSKWKRAKSAMMKAGGNTSESAEKEPNGETATKDDTIDGVTGKEAEASSSTSPADASEGQAGAQSKEKVGVPIFRDELGTRRMYLAVELGKIYRPRDVIIQVTASASASFIVSSLKTMPRPR